MNPTASPEPIAGRPIFSAAEKSRRAASSGFESARRSLRPHLAELDRFLRSEIAALEPEIREMAEYCLDAGGKRIRPALVFLSGWRETGQVQPELVRVAAVVELVHLATLVHDDIMDEAEVRRGRRTAARVYGSVAAVLLGDALFAHALHLAAQFPTTEVCLAVSASTRRVCAGEIVQTLRRGSRDFSVADYRRVIDLKTAELFRASCRLGSALAGNPPAFVEAAGRFGRHLGVAYQIYDDLADYFGEEKRIGKTLGTDLASGKLTLPLLLLLGRLNGADKEELLQEIQGNRPPQLALHLRQMRELGVFAAVEQEIQVEITAARQALEPWEDSAQVAGMLALCDAISDQVDTLRTGC
jgi:octaprenyl-diphosphate synthase